MTSLLQSTAKYWVNYQEKIFKIKNISSFKGQNALTLISAGALSQTPLGKLTAKEGDAMRYLASGRRRVDKIKSKWELQTNKPRLTTKKYDSQSIEKWDRLDKLFVWKRSELSDFDSMKLESIG